MTFNIKRTAVLLLCLTMIFSLMPSAVMADDIESWHVERMNNHSGTATIDRSVYAHGNGSLKLTSPDPTGDGRYIMLTQNVNLKKGKIYYFGAYAKAEKATADFQMIINWEKRYSFTDIGQSFDWTEFTWMYYSTENQTITLRICLEGITEAVWLDDIHFTDIETDENLLKNTTFDTVSSSSKDGAINAQIPAEKYKNDEIYKNILSSDVFSIEDMNKIQGALKYIPVQKAENITIDGNGDDWGNYNKIYLPTLPEQYFDIANDGKPFDLDGYSCFAYDDKYFYVYTEVEDDVHYVIPGGNYWQTDCIQYAISTLDESFGTEIGFLYDPKDDYCDIHGLGNGSVPAMTKAKREGTKTIYEMAYPWDIKFTEVPSEFKFNMIVNDNDGGERRYDIEYAPGISASKDNARFPILSPVKEGNEWYAWIEAGEGTELYINEEHSFNYFVVNDSDAEKKIKVINNVNDEAELLTVPAHSGVHREMKITFTEPANFDLMLDFEDESGRAKQAKLDLRLIQMTATVEETKKYIEVLENQVKQLKKKIAECNKKGISTQYEDNRTYILGNWIEFLNEDIANNDLYRVHYTARTTTKIYERTMADLEAYLKGEKKPRSVPVYLNDEVEMDKTGFYSNVELPDGTVTKQPVALQGYMLARDYAETKNYGGNITQIEIGPSMWMNRIPSWSLGASGGDCSYGYSTEIKHSGNHSFKMEYKSEFVGNTFYLFTQTVPTKPGETYILKGWVKGDNVQGATIMPGWWNYPSQYLLEGTYDWKEFETSAVADGDSMILMWLIDCPGTVYLDDLELYCDSDPQKTNLLKNAGFEDGDGVLPVADKTATEFISQLNRLEVCEENNIWVDFQVGPNCFWPDIIEEYGIAQEGGVMVKFNINAPLAKQLVEEHIRTILPIVLEYDCVKSINLVNEPDFETNRCGDFYNEDWWGFLRNRYNNSIEELNASYGTSFTDFTQVDMEADNRMPAKNYDYETFNAKVFAQWHGWMADIIREYTDLPIGTKIFHYTYGKQTNMIGFGMNYEYYKDILTINNCDGYNYYDNEQDPLTKEMWYDYLQSVIDAPVLDSENHSVRDHSDKDLAEEIDMHMAQDNYNGAMHGRVAIVNWGLARNANADNMVRGLHSYRPGAMANSSDVGLDMLRLSNEIKAINDEPHEIGIFYTNASIMNNMGSLQAAYQVYANSCYNGKTPRFVFESQLDKMYQYPILIIPMMEYAAQETMDEIANYIRQGGKVLICGRNSFKKTDRNLEPNQETRQYIFDNSTVIDMNSSNGSTPVFEVKTLNETIRQMLIDNNMQYVEVIDAETGEPINNVDYNAAICGGKLILNVCNYKDKLGADIRVNVYVGGKKVEKMLDLRSMEELGDEIFVRAYDVTTVQIEVDNPFFDTYKHWGKDEIQALYNKGLVKGVSSSRFKPDEQITRAEFLTMITRALELPETKYRNQVSDVAGDAWYADIIAQGIEAKLIDNSAFRPNDAITREEMCEILIKAYEYKNGAAETSAELSFKDTSQIKDINSVKKAIGLGLMKGNEDGTFAPNSSATRAESSAVINRFIEL
ncbi:MAG: S-layer homology domain-containing protein [Clostridia bacterium]|nr:S-layer homology domain-containing protein [Clostridia bacterium]